MNNTVTQKHINDLINKSEITTTTVHNKVTVVSAKLPNGFVITESSACVDPKNYSEKLGRNICLERIENKLWELEGYLLSQKLFEAEAAPSPKISDDPMPEILDKLPKSVVELLIFESNAARNMIDIKYTQSKHTAFCTAKNLILHAEGQNLINAKESALLKREFLGEEA